MRVKRTWKPGVVMADRRELSEFHNMLVRMADRAEGTNHHWELGMTAFMEFVFLAREEKKRVQRGKVFIGMMDGDLSPPTHPFRFPIKENWNLPEYAVVLHYERKEKDPMEKETRTYCVDTEGGTHEYVAVGYANAEGYLTVYDENHNIATYAPQAWDMIWEKDRCLVD